MAARYLSIDVAYQTVGNCDVEFAPKDAIIELLKRRLTLDVTSRDQWLADLRQAIKIHRIDVSRCLPTGTKISQTSSVERTRYLVATLSKLSPVGDTRQILVEEQPEIPGVSRVGCGAFFTTLTFFEMRGQKVTTVASGLKTSIGFICTLKEFRAWVKSRRASATSHEAAKDFSKFNLKCIAMLLRDPTILKGIGDGANIPAANMDDAADAFMQALVYHLTKS